MMLVFVIFAGAHERGIVVSAAGARVRLVPPPPMTMTAPPHPTAAPRRRSTSTIGTRTVPPPPPPPHPLPPPPKLQTARKKRRVPWSPRGRVDLQGPVIPRSLRCLLVPPIPEGGVARRRSLRGRGGVAAPVLLLQERMLTRIQAMTEPVVGVTA